MLVNSSDGVLNDEIKYYFKLETMWVVTNIASLDRATAYQLLDSLWYDNSLDLTLRAPSSVFRLMNSMISDGNATIEYQESAIHSVSNALADSP